MAERFQLVPILTTTMVGGGGCIVVVVVAVVVLVVRWWSLGKQEAVWLMIGIRLDIV